MSKRNIFLSSIALLCCTLIAAGVILNGIPAIDWWLIDAGGGSANASNVSLYASLGQPVIGVSEANNITLESGYWVGGEQTGLRIFLPQVSR